MFPKKWVKHEWESAYIIGPYSVAIAAGTDLQLIFSGR